ncbi:alpha/beta fold hydrolase [Paenibacillus monticola]|uniref:Alpha/beta fold hydrolase n=1 Tax=Paenibacillus monticola TaxID=2666075 RepID=A0A7X2H1J2_9BACL|nr:alpha/beta fold hydrolase [Paenibacillus monticola]MRN51871.1 alpha/beta fold hydrolase [Paenibacillus monticola]
MDFKNNYKFTMLMKHDNLFVRHHRINGQHAVPGAVFLDSIFRALTSRGFDPASLELRDILFLEPVMISKTMDKAVQIVLERTAEDWSFKVQCRDEKNGNVMDPGWKDVLEGKVCLSGEPEIYKIDIPQLKIQATQVENIERSYAQMRKAGLCHYDFMKLQGEVYMNASYLLAEVSLSSLAERYCHQFFIHPAFLDGAFLVPGVVSADSESAEQPFIPMYVQSFRAFGPIRGKGYIHISEDSVKRSPAQDIIYFDVQLYHDNGEVAAYYKMFGARRIDFTDRKGGAKPAGDPILSEMKGGTEPAVIPTPANTANPALVIVPAASKSATRSHIEKMLAEAISAITGNLPAETSLTDDFYSQGLDSKNLLTLVGKLEGEFGIKMYPTLLFEYTNIKALSQYIEKEQRNTVNQNVKAIANKKAITELSHSVHGSEASANIKVMAVNSLRHSQAVVNYWKQMRIGKTPDREGVLLNREQLELILDCDPSLLVHLTVQTKEDTAIEMAVSGQGETVLLIPGFGFTASQWVSQMKEWSSSFRLIAIHMPGTSLSESTHDLSMEGISNTFMEVVEQLSPSGPIHIVGSSWGGMLGQYISALHPEKVASLTLAGSFAQGVEKLYEIDMRERLRQDFDNLGRSKDYLKVLDSEFVNYAILSEFGEHMGNSTSSVKILSMIKTPTLIVSGRKDMVFDTDESRFLHERIPHSELLEIPTAGHLPNITHSKLFTEKVQEFIQSKSIRTREIPLLNY